MSFLLAMLAFSSFAMWPSGASAQGLGELGLPELDVTVTETTISGIPDTLEANRYLVRVTADTAEPAGVEFARPAEGTGEAFLDALDDLHAGHAHEEPVSTPGDGHDDGDDAHGDGMEMHEESPEASHDDGADAHDEGEAAHDDAGEMHEESPEAGHDMADEHEDEPAAMDMEMSPVYAATFAGGVLAQPGVTAEVVVDLGPGEWFVTGGSDGSQEPVAFTVTGEMPDDLPEPTADATMILGEYIIEVVEGEITSGPMVLRVDNIGAQPHQVDFSLTDTGASQEEIVAAISAVEEGGTPPTSAFDPDHDLHLVTATTTQSTGTSIWVTLDLEPGSYVLLCHFPDMADGQTHSAHGMVRVVELGE